MTPTVGYGTNHSFTSLGPITFERRDLNPDDVRIDILYCGVCHSDIHQCENDWGNTVYPCVPGHEIVGRVAEVGGAVTKYKPGDLVGVGCMVDSCGQCPNCREDLEQYCEGPKGPTMTYNGPFKPDGTNTYGGYSGSVVVKEHFVLRVPTNLDLKGVAPLLCAGVTTYSPLRHWNVRPGQRVGVVGLGGLGHMAVKLAAAMGAEVTVFSTSEEKRSDALRLGAKSFVLSTDDDAMEQLELKFDFVLSTVPDAHDINPYAKLLKRDATLAVVGTLVPFSKPTDNSQIAFHRRTVAGSLIGGIAETQEVLDFCGQHNITSDVEVIAMEDINKAFKRVKKGDVRYRFVIDIANTLKPN
jgi:uncharacterized zinc-type alcohol dehydrogenase-like protein